MNSNSPLCVAVLGQPDSDWLGTLLAQLPPDIELIVLDSDARIADCVDAGQNTLRVRANAPLPPHALRRLLDAAAQFPDHDVISACDIGVDALNPLPEGRTFAGDLMQLDAALWLLGRHALRPCGAAIGTMAWFGAQSAKRLTHGLPLRCSALDSLHVAAADGVPAGVPAPTERHLAPLQTALSELRAALREVETVPAVWPGLDRRSTVLHILHGWGGGVERFALDLADGDSERWHFALIAHGEWSRTTCGERLELALLHGGQRWPLQQISLATPIVTCAIEHAEWRSVVNGIRTRFAIASVIVSSLIGHSLDALTTGLPTEFFCHDYFPLWPILHADFDQLAGDASELGAQLATAKAPEFPFAERDPSFWRNLRGALLERLLTNRPGMSAPAHCVRRNWLKFAPELSALTFEVIGHGLREFGAAPLPRAPARDRMRIVVLGRINGGKGERLLRDLLRTRLREHADLYLIGCGRAGLGFLGEPGLHLVFDYVHAELPGLLASIAPDAALLPATVAESFSYTLSELRALGIPPIATRRGAFIERIRDEWDGLLVDPDAEAIAALIESLHDDPGALAAIREQLARGSTTSSLAGMADAHRTFVGAQARTPVWREAVDAEQATLAARLLEFERECTELRAVRTRQEVELARRAEWAQDLNRQWSKAIAEQKALQAEVETFGERLALANSRCTALEGDVAERTAWALRLDEEIRQLGNDLQAAHQRFVDAQSQWEQAANHFQNETARLEREKSELLSSLSWRLTRPLRYMRRQLGNARVSTGYYVRRLLGLPPRVIRSLRIRGFKGTLERARGSSTPAPLELPKPDIAPVAETGSAPAEQIAFERVDAPRASIIIPVYNKWRYTEACLRSLAATPQQNSFEVIVVDDGSSDETWERLQGVAGIVAHRNAENLGFVGSCNAGAARARGDFLVFLNNDTQVAPNWLDALIDTFASHVQVGLAGAKLVYPDGRLQEAGGIVFSDGSGWNYGRLGDPRDPAHNYVRDVDYCSGAAIALPRDLFERLGGFDNRYAPAYYEDTDLAFKVREAGLRVLYQPASTVFHYEGVTAGTDIGSGTKKYQVVNQKKFVERWATALAQQPASGTPISLAREHRRNQRILIIDATTPHADEDSGSVRMVNLMRVLIALGHKVVFFAENRAYDGRYTEFLQQLGVEVLFHPWMPEPTRWLREHGAQFDAVMISRHYVAAPLIEAVRHYAPKARLVFDTVDLHFLREEREAALTGRDDLRKQAMATKASELRLIRQSDVTLVVSPIERELLEHEMPGARVEVLSNVHEVAGRGPSFGERKDLYFVGGFQHQPNVDAMLWFAHAVWPLIAGSLPEARFHIVGSKMPDSIRALATDRIIVHGFLPSLDAMLDGCRLSVAPLRYGAGVKGKVNQSMAHGQPVVATTVAAEGMYLTHDVDVLIADDAAAFANEVVRLYTDEVLWNRLADAALANIERHFSFDAAKQAIRQVLG